MSPNSKEVGQGITKLPEPSIETLDKLDRFLLEMAGAVGKKFDGKATITGLIVDGKYIHPLLNVTKSPDKKEIMVTLGGKDLRNLFAVRHEAIENVPGFVVYWRGKTGKRFYSLAPSKLTPTEKLKIGLYRGVIIFPFPTEVGPLSNNFWNIFYYESSQLGQRDIMIAIKNGLQKAAGGRLPAY